MQSEMWSRVWLLAGLVGLAGLVTLAGSGRPAEVVPAAAGEGACTSFCLDNGGRAVFGTNYDNPIWEGMVLVNQRGVSKTGWEAGTSGKVARWTAEYGSVSFNLAGSQLVWAGMNEAGLTVSTMWLRDTENPAPDERPGLASPLWLQYQLDTCATLAEVMANDGRVRIVDTVDHYLVCDRSGACAAVEFLEGETVFHTGDALPVKTLTNHNYQAAAAAWRAGRLVDNSLERFGLAADRVTGFATTDAAGAVAYAFDTLEQASGLATGGTMTQWSIAFDTERMRVHWRTSRNRQIRWLDFARLDFTCGAPAQMLDVHAPLAGDASGELLPLTFADNLARTLGFLDKWGATDLSPLEVEVLERGLDSFGCQRPPAPYQAEVKPALSPLVGWVALALIHRLWPLGVVVGLALVGLIVWRARAGRRDTSS